MHKSIFSFWFLTTLLIGDENLAIAGAPKSVALTIYTNNMAMVSEKRSAEIGHPGNVKLMYSGVPSTIDTASVLVHFDQPAQLYSQNYSYDLISFNSLLKYHLGQNVFYTQNKESNERKEGTLLSENPILIQEQDQGAIYTPHQLFFPSIPKEMAVKPSLFWNIKTDANHLDISLQYLTSQIGWKSDYTLDLGDNGKLDLGAWITIDNRSGASFQDANITVLAGDVHMPTRVEPRSYDKGMLAAAPSADNITNEPFSGYHLYAIPFLETINDKEQKQISFIDKKGIPFDEYALNEQNDYFSNFGERELQFDHIVALQNSQANHLGIPLPRGTVRAYKKDKQHRSQFIGADFINDIPKEEEFKINIGKYFDIAGKERVKEFRVTKQQQHIVYEITLNNHSQKSEIIKLKKNTPPNLGKLAIKDSCTAPCAKETLSAFSTLYTLTLAPEESYTLSVSYDMELY